MASLGPWRSVPLMHLCAKTPAKRIGAARKFGFGRKEKSGTECSVPAKTI
jgi:hypothetical protein